MRKLTYRDAGIIGIIGCLVFGICFIIINFIGVENVPEFIKFITIVVLAISLLLLCVWFWVIMDHVQDWGLMKIKEWSS